MQRPVGKSLKGPRDGGQAPPSGLLHDQCVKRPSCYCWRRVNNAGVTASKKGENIEERLARKSPSQSNQNLNSRFVLLMLFLRQVSLHPYKLFQKKLKYLTKLLSLWVRMVIKQDNFILIRKSRSILSPHNYLDPNHRSLLEHVDSMLGRSLMG